ncbi:MAG: orotate phosphoribosyltransferase [Butyricicoccaceae bacterium]
MSSLESRIIKFSSKKHGNVVPIKAIPGHFATNHSHINYYIDLTTLKARQTEAEQCAHAMAQQYMHDMIVDTIVCLDGMEVIGAFLAKELIKNGVISRNTSNSIYVITPERTANSQLIFRENVEPMIRDKNILLLMASVTTGISVHRGADILQYYGGILRGVSTIFSAVNHVDKIQVNSLYTPNDIPGYASYSRSECPYCKKKEPVEALVNSYGYSKL